MPARAGWTDEELRVDLQDRLATLSALMFWSFIALLAFMHLMYWRYPDIKPDREDTRGQGPSPARLRKITTHGQSGGQAQDGDGQIGHHYTAAPLNGRQQ